MPMYKYKCKNCGYCFEKLQRISDAYPESSCCDNVRLQRLISGTSFNLTGGGWFKDGYNKDNAVADRSNGGE